jgi:hypothetical protein
LKNITAVAKETKQILVLILSSSKLLDISEEDHLQRYKGCICLEEYYNRYIIIFNEFDSFQATFKETGVNTNVVFNNNSTFHL